MAILRMKEIRSMGKDELKKKLEEFKLELSKEEASAYIGAAKSPGRIRELRRTIARIKTVMGEK